MAVAEPAKLKRHRIGQRDKPGRRVHGAPLPVRDPGATQVRAPGEQIRALDDLEILRRVLAALHGL
jgi:hypothetical protein